ncbi:FliM/FliN family flagellar motor switch protein [Phaeovulum sp.]|uniref:FliM/FliN family flagellar motor switch protein n=1 Tax=Phaeovulum sp. TaxID=2934796 RepID=UPI0039E70AF3
MPEEKPKTVLSKMAEAGRPPADGVPMSSVRALRQALAKAAQDIIKLPLTVIAVNERRMTLSDLPETLEDHALLAVIEGPAEALGLIALSPPMLAALIEMQTMGRLGARAPAVRKPTRTDASMSADLLDGVLIGFEAALAEMPEIVWAGGFRYASFLDDPRPLGLLLEDCAYRVFEVQLTVGLAGAREGGFMLALPATGRGPGPQKMGVALGEASTPEAGGENDVGEWPEQMSRAVMSTHVTLEAVLHRVTLPLQAVMSFQPGMVLPMSMATLETLSIEGAGGRCIARARLGQQRGFRAARLIAEDADLPLGGVEPPEKVPAASAEHALPVATKKRVEPDAPPAEGSKKGEPAPFTAPGTGAGAAAPEYPQQNDEAPALAMKTGSGF